jgi:hypothetical protein
MKFSSLNYDKKIKRKKFFVAAAASVATYTVLRSFPFNLFTGKKEMNKIDNSKKNMVKENPLAVSRKNTGGGDVRS